MKRLNIKYFDMVPALLNILKNGVDPQEEPNDSWHPSQEASRYFANFLLVAGLIPGEGKKK